MKQIILSVEAAKVFFTDLRRALEPVALDGALVMEKFTDRDVRNFAEIIREQVLLAEDKRLAGNRKAAK